MSESISVLLADDHPALRMGLRVLLEQAPDIRVTGEAGDGTQALAQVEQLQPAVVVLDCELPGMEGARVAAEIRRRGLSTRVLALSAHADERYVRGMIDAGAVGYLLKEEAPGIIVAAVRAAAKGAGWFSPAVATQVAAWARGDPTPSAVPDLDRRQRTLLGLLAAGKTNKEISLAMGISEKTVEKYLGELFEKLKVSSRVEAAVLAVRHGLA